MKKYPSRVFLNFIFLMILSEFVCASQTASVTDKTMTSPMVSSLRPVHLLLAYGSESRSEKDSNGQWQLPSYNNYSLSVSGFGENSKSWLLTAEKSEFEEKSGTNVLSVQRKFEDYLLFVDYRSSYTLAGFKQASWWQQLYPFMGFGFGGYRQIVDTNLMGQRKSDETDFKLLTALRFGLAWQFPLLWISAEGRLLIGDEMQQQPSFGTLLRVGFWL